MELFFIYVTCPNKDIAQEIAIDLIEKKLIACANIFPIDSLFAWNDSVSKENEYVLLVKTIHDHSEEIEKEIEKIHPYTIACISKIKTHVNEKFYQWVKEQVQ